MDFRIIYIVLSDGVLVFHPVVLGLDLLLNEKIFVVVWVVSRLLFVSLGSLVLALALAALSLAWYSSHWSLLLLRLVACEVSLRVHRLLGVEVAIARYVVVLVSSHFLVIGRSGVGHRHVIRAIFSWADGRVLVVVFVACVSEVLTSVRLIEPLLGLKERALPH